MTVNRIWISSLQKYIKVKEMSCEDRRTLTKSIEDDIDFDSALDRFLQENICEKDFDITQLTILDRFLIILQSRVYSCGDKLRLNRICEKCDTKTDFVVDLNNLLDNLSVVDKSFEEIINYHPYKIIANLPSTKEYLWAKNNTEGTLYSYIKKLLINDKIITDFTNIPEIDFGKKLQVCGQMPINLLFDLEKYVKSISETINKIPIAKLVCKNEKCKDESLLNMEVNNLLELTKLLFKDASIHSILGQYANISMNCHFDFDFYKNLSPIELDVISDMLKSNSESSSPAPTNSETNFFEEYRMQTQGMVESPSEFR